MSMNTSQQSSEDGESSIQKQLWYLRHEDPTQYHTLIKMHLSFTTDLPTDQCDSQSAEQTSGRRWQLTPLIRRLGLTSAGNKGVMEGAPLTQEGVCQAFQLIHYLNKDYNITQEGLFRKSGSLSRQQELKALLNSGCDLNLDYGTYSAHDCASVLKSFLADLPEPLLTEGHYSIHCKIAEMIQSNFSHDEKEVTRSRQIKALRLLFLLLPPENYQLLHDVLILLHRVAAHQKQNLMSAVNLGTMFAPHILCPRKMTPNDLQYQSGILSIAVAFMIEQALQLFKIPLELEYDVRQYWSNKKKMRHQLSKRSMMDAPAKTIFTFIDRELTAQANDKDVTEVALAELYAYVQSLPDSAKKRRLIKQFNHASASGTPQLNRSIIKKQEARGKKLGDSIKKHLFHKTVKSSKSKSQPFSSFGYTRVKHNNSDDLLGSPSTRSPELRMFRRNPELNTPIRLKAKSLDDLSSSISNYHTTATSSTNHSLLSFIGHPAFHPDIHLHQEQKQTFPVTIPSFDRKECHSSAYSDQGSNKDPMSPLLLPFLSLDSSCDALEVTRETDSGQSIHEISVERLSQSTVNFPSTALEDTKENAPPWDNMLASTPAGPQLEIHSPISQAMISASIPQKVIMTPRSRCPIIINSATSLSSVAIPEEKSSHSSVYHDLGREKTDMLNGSIHTTPVITNPAAQLTSPVRPIQPLTDSTNLSSPDHVKKDMDDDLKCEKEQQRMSHDCKKMDRENKLSRWSSSSLRRTLSSVSSNSSLFGSFFHHLSTSSLAQLATRLTSSSSVKEPEVEEEKESQDSFVEEDDGEMNESLSSVFKDYLLSRSILTDNPVDLSTYCLDDEEPEEGAKIEKDNGMSDVVSSDEHEEADDDLGDSAYGGSQPLSKCTSQQCSKTSLGSLDSAVDIYTSSNLSSSLLYCLDGNNPLSPSISTAEGDCNKVKTELYTHDPLTHSPSSLSGEQDGAGEQLSGLHSCSPDSRCQSLLKTKQGTPVPQREKKHSGSASGARGVVFETSF